MTTDKTTSRMTFIALKRDHESGSLMVMDLGEFQDHVTPKDAREFTSERYPHADLVCITTVSGGEVAP